MFAKKDYIVAKRDFSRVKSPFEKTFSIPNIKAGFAKCGVYPFNRNAVPIEKMIPSVLHKSSLSASSGSSSDSPRSSSCDSHPGSSPSEMFPDHTTPPNCHICELLSWCCACKLHPLCFTYAVHPLCFAYELCCACELYTYLCLCKYECYFS